MKILLVGIHLHTYITSSNRNPIKNRHQRDKEMKNVDELPPLWLLNQYSPKMDSFSISPVHPYLLIGKGDWRGLLNSLVLLSTEIVVKGHEDRNQWHDSSQREECLWYDDQEETNPWEREKCSPIWDEQSFMERENFYQVRGEIFVKKYIKSE